MIDKHILKIHNYIYANDGLSNSETLSEFLKLFYCKIIDEENNNLLFSAKNENEIIEIVNELFNTLKNKLKNIFDTNDKINLKNSTIIFAINELKNINISKIKSDIKGHILQKIIDRSYRENRGQFFTPAPVVDLMVKIISPKRGEIGGDPACGTGGFMFEVLNYLSKTGIITVEDISNITFNDISKSLIKLIVMRMMFEYSCENFNFSVTDSIENFDEFMKYDYILTNPPFGSQGKIDNSKILSKYDLGIDEKGKIFKSQVPDILFVEKVIKILKNNGRAGIVLPDGDFENPSLKYFRKYLVENVRIDAIISLPDGTFIPYGTGIKSSIIFFSRIDKKDLTNLVNNNYEIFYGKITKLGYSFSKHSKSLYTKDGLIDEDYTKIANSYLSRNNFDDNCYLVPIQDVIMNNYILSENFHSPVYKREIDKIKSGRYLRLKDLAKIVYNKEKIDNEKLYNYIEIGDISPYTSEIINSNSILGEDLPSRASYIVNTNDIIVATAGNAIGTSKQAKALVPEQFDNSICTNGFSVIKSEKYSPYFLIDYFNSKSFLTQMSKIKYGTAIPAVTRDDFENLLVPIPNDIEINKIENRIKKAYELRKEANELLKN